MSANSSDEQSSYSDAEYDSSDGFERNWSFDDSIEELRAKLLPTRGDFPDCVLVKADALRWQDGQEHRLLLAEKLPKAPLLDEFDVSAIPSVEKKAHAKYTYKDFPAPGCTSAFVVGRSGWDSRWSPHSLIYHCISPTEWLGVFGKPVGGGYTEPMRMRASEPKLYGNGIIVWQLDFTRGPMYFEDNASDMTFSSW